MADLIVPNGKGKRMRSIPRVDLTPMVDLGFLLITFFMYTTTMAKPKVMSLQMPYDNGEKVEGTAYPEESTVTIIPVAAHRIVWYSGNPQHPQSVARCGFDGKASLRERIIAAQKDAASLPANLSKEAHQLHIIIKPDVSSTYEDLVHILDEMSINNVQRYAIANIDDADKNRLSAYGK